MKIVGPGHIQSTSLKKASRKKDGARTAFSDELQSGSAAGSATGPAGPTRLTPVDALLALQEVPNSTESRSKGLARANEMLDMLEEVRKGILLGVIPAPQLRSLADMARNHRENASDELKSDAQLSEILSDIELRAEVELAKLGL